MFSLTRWQLIFETNFTLYYYQSLKKKSKKLYSDIENFILSNNLRKKYCRYDFIWHFLLRELFVAMKLLQPGMLSAELHPASSLIPW